VPRYSETRGRPLTRFEAFSERFAMSRLGQRYLLHLAPRIDRFVIPRTEGRWSSAGKNAVGLLRSTGARSGQERLNPLTCAQAEDGALLLIGSNYGGANHPGWSANLRAHPECTFTYAGETHSYRARELAGEERARAWGRVVDFYAGYAAYEATAKPRVIRVFRLEPA